MISTCGDLIPTRRIGLKAGVRVDHTRCVVPKSIMEQNKYYPGIGHALLLIVAILVLQFGMAIPLSIAGLIFGIDLQEPPVLMAFVSIFSFGLVLVGGQKKNQKPATEIFPVT